jgi:hypothetical protein
MPSTPQESPQTSEYAKVPNVAGLYRNTRTGRYYGCKKVEGRRKERSLAEDKLSDVRKAFEKSPLSNEPDRDAVNAVLGEIRVGFCM